MEIATSVFSSWSKRTSSWQCERERESKGGVVSVWVIERGRGVGWAALGAVVCKFGLSVAPWPSWWWWWKQRHLSHKPESPPSVFTLLSLTLPQHHLTTPFIHTCLDCVQVNWKIVFFAEFSHHFVTEHESFSFFIYTNSRWGKRVIQIVVGYIALTGIELSWSCQKTWGSRVLQTMPRNTTYIEGACFVAQEGGIGILLLL